MLCCFTLGANSARWCGQRRMRHAALAAFWLFFAAPPSLALPYDIETDGIERRMWCKCSTFNCNCAYRLRCRTAPRKVLSWLGTAAKPEVCREGASYMGTCFCHKSCACNTTEPEASKRVYGNG